jgi:hypothetical protein
MRTVSVGLLVVALLATLGVGLLSCAYEVAPTAPGATPLPQATLSAYSPIPTPAMPTPGAGATLASSETKNYIGDGRTYFRDKLALQKGDIVMFTVSTTGQSVSVDVDQPDGFVAMTPCGTPGGEVGKYSFQAAMDGDYRLNVTEGRVQAPGGAITLKIDIYR